MTPELIAMFGQFGPLGLMIGYLVWRENKVAAQIAERDLARAKADEARAESDKALSGSLSAVAVTVQNFDQRLTMLFDQRPK
ncbi:hypothetical protein [Blastomonas sp.]|uniref:hypothetical protein n=1 Tax=Blastomonas sp. TaxID=1909299 RepID=UPI00391BC539